MAVVTKNLFRVSCKFYVFQPVFYLLLLIALQIIAPMWACLEQCHSVSRLIIIPTEKKFGDYSFTTADGPSHYVGLWICGECRVLWSLNWKVPALSVFGIKLEVMEEKTSQCVCVSIKSSYHLSFPLSFLPFLVLSLELSLCHTGEVEGDSRWFLN